MDEKRRHRRKSYRISVDYSDGRRFYQRTVADISYSGLFIKTPKPLPVGEGIMLCFELRGKPFRIRARVVRHDPLGMGVRFSSASDDDRKMLQELVGRI